MLGIVPTQLLQVGGATLLAPDAVQVYDELAQAQRLEKAPRHLDDLSVQRRIAVADGLRAELLVLAEPALLRALVTKYRGEVVQAHRLRQVLHAVLQVGAAYRGGPLGAQRHALAAAILESVRLLLHDVGPRPDGSHKQTGILENGGIDARIAVELTQLRSFALDISIVALLLRQDVYRAPGCLVQICSPSRLEYTEKIGL